MVNYIKDNYLYFQKLYQVYDNSAYRNDYSFSIALHTLNGFRIPGHEWDIPHRFILLSPKDRLYRIDKAQTKVIFDTLDNKGKHNLLNIQDQSYHCMNKISMHEKYDQFIEVYDY